MRTEAEIEKTTWERLNVWLEKEYGFEKANDIRLAYLEISTNEIRKELKMPKGEQHIKF